MLDYFQTPHTGKEGWFGHDTPEGGADKMGHLYSSYLMNIFVSEILPRPMAPFPP